MSTPNVEIAPRLELALTASREAGLITLEYFRRDDLEVELKGDDTPVTAADRLRGAAPSQPHRRGVSR